VKDHRTGESHTFLFWTCFVSLVATSFGFISRSFMLEDWGEEFGLEPVQLGEIFGAGLWPFAISIVVISLFIDRIGYKAGMWIALICHLASGVMTIMATGYQSLYWAAFVGALGNGAIEAVINPVIAAVKSQSKTKWLNILHAGWPAGLALAGVLTIALNAMDKDWRVKVALIFIPVVAYGIMFLRCKFPVSERVAAGVPYRDMIAEAGGLGLFVVFVMMFVELGRVLTGFFMSEAITFPDPRTYIFVGLAAVIAFGIGIRVKAVIGRPLYILFLLVMLLLATTEVGTDGWIKDLMTPAMELIGLNAGWILVYTATIMTVLRFLVGPIMNVTRLSPLGLLALSCVMVIAGIFWLSSISTSAALPILIASTIYGAGQCFFWPTTLGVIAEQFPKGGALTLNAIAGVGMLGVGILGAPWLGYVQNSTIESALVDEGPAMEQILGGEQSSIFGNYRGVDSDKLAALDPTGADRVKAVETEAKAVALRKVVILPALMLAFYLSLMAWNRRRGGYQPVQLEHG